MRVLTHAGEQSFVHPRQQESVWKETVPAPFAQARAKASLTSSVWRSTQPRSSRPFMYLPSSNFCSRHTSVSFLISFSIVSSLTCTHTHAPTHRGWPWRTGAAATAHTHIRTHTHTHTHTEGVGPGPH